MTLEASQPAARQPRLMSEADAVAQRARLPTKKKQITMWVGEKWLVERQLNIGGRAYATDLPPRPQRTVGPNSKNPPKIRLPKFVKLTLSYLFLQLFDKFLT